MKSRSLASLAVGALIILGASGCTFITPQATTIEYSASDGVNVPDVDGAPLQVRNAIIVTDEGLDVGNLIAAVVNPTDSGQTLTVGWGDGQETTVRVPADKTVSFGAETTDYPISSVIAETPPTLQAMTEPAGSTIPVFFQSGDAQGVIVEVPILDGQMAYLDEFVPTPSPESTTAAE